MELNKYFKRLLFSILNINQPIQPYKKEFNRLIKEYEDTYYVDFLSLHFGLELEIQSKMGDIRSYAREWIYEKHHGKRLY